MPSDAANEITRRQWRELGFFYDRDDEAKAWKLVGSRAGLLRFRDALLLYVADPRKVPKSEHDSYGPYSFLEVMTWPEAGFDEHAIRGPLTDLRRLAELIESKLATSRPGSSIRIREEFADHSPYALVLEVQGDGFDPAAADSLLPAEESATRVATIDIPNFHDGHFDGLWIGPSKLVNLFLRTQDEQSYILTLRGVDTLRMSEIRQGNILFDLVLRNNQELTAADIANLFGVDDGSSQASNLLKAKRDEGFQLLEVNSSYGAHGRVLFQKIEVRQSTPD